MKRRLAGAHIAYDSISISADISYDGALARAVTDGPMRLVRTTQFDSQFERLFPDL